jgi:hypothetical protein
MRTVEHVRGDRGSRVERQVRADGVAGRRYAIVASRFNEVIVRRLVDAEHGSDSLDGPSSKSRDGRASRNL